LIQGLAQRHRAPLRFCEQMSKTIAVLIDHADYPAGGYESLLRAGFESASKRLGLNLLLFFGRALNAPMYTAQNAIYRLAHPDCVDGLILVAPGLGTYTGAPGVIELAEKLAWLPRVSLGLRIPGVASIVIDNEPGIHALVDHLVDTHRCHAPAFIGGPELNPDAALRAQAFRAALVHHNLPFEPARVHAGDFTLPSGSSAMATILERGVYFDSVLAANDGMALGAIETLKARGFRVPHQIHVCGFDDLEIARLVNPPLTTVRQPLQEMAVRAVELLFEQINGNAVAECTKLEVELVRRRSCGCARVALPSAPPSVLTNRPPGAVVAERAERLVTRMVRHLSDAGENAREMAQTIVKGLRDQLEGQATAFEIALDTVIDQVGERRELYEQLQEVISLLRSELSDCGPATEQLWHEGRALLALASTRASGRQRLHTEMQYQHLVRGGERLLTAFDLYTLKRILAEELPEMQVMNALFALYQGPSKSELVPFLYLRRGVAVELPPESYPATKLVPKGVELGSRGQTSFVWPLAAEHEQFGVAVIELCELTSAPEMLREQITAALRSAALHREIVHRTALHERSVQERLATAKRMSALNVLAGGVAHDLNNALGPLVALPDLIVRELEDFALDPAVGINQVCSDVLAIKAASLRAVQTIKDLLTSARQGRTHKEVIDLNRLVEALVQAEAPGLSQNGEIEFAVGVSSEPLYISASESHVQRALSNLLRNASEAIEAPGRVAIRTARVEVHEPFSGYETIEPGDYAMISVTDTGRGISQQELGRVFEPFFTKKRVGESSGSGLGLAIVHGVIKEHGGFVNVESEPNRGTTFTLFFARVEPPARASETSNEIPVSRTGLNILIVDDDPMQLRTARRILERRGHTITTMTSGRQAFLLFEQAYASAPDAPPYDLVVLDMLLNEPDDGLVLAERVAALFPEQRCVIVSGHAPNERGLRAVERGLGWLCKPYTADQLTHTIDAAVDAETAAATNRGRLTGT
jgi:DNA-binding LacI/PurR family transcriptional regulator/signal transduction histidine kinase/ActR/RegA family two-component response regulator